MNPPKILNLKAAAKNMKAMSKDVIKTTFQEIESTWYHSDADADMMVWKDRDKKLIKNQITLSGQIVEWNPLDGWRTGLLVEEEGRLRVPSRTNAGATDILVSEVIYFDREPNEQTLFQVRTLIENAESLPSEDRDFLLLALKGKETRAETFHKMKVRFHKWLGRFLKI